VIAAPDFRFLSLKAIKAANNGFCLPDFAKGHGIVTDTSTGGKIRYGKKKDV
jgi:hypothetical protein